MSTDEPLFVVSLPRAGKLPRLVIVLCVPLLLANLLAGRVPGAVHMAALFLSLALLGWALILRSSHYLQVREDSLTYVYSLNSRQKQFSPAEIQSARYTGVVPFRYLVLIGRDGQRLAALEADMENMNKLKEYLKKNHISIQ